MPSRLQITLSVEATARYLEIASGRTTAEINADCEPSGTCIKVDIDPIFSSDVMVERGNNNWIDVGSADVYIVDSE